MARVAVIVLALVAACEASKTAGTGSGSAGSTQPRIVSLSPSATEIVGALGATSWLVGVDNYSEFPPEVQALPKVGTYIAPNLETIVRLRPTLVIVDDVHGQQAAALGDRGVVTVECAMHALPDVKSALKLIGQRIGKTAEADAAIAGIDKALDDAAAKKPARHPRVLAVIDRETGGLGNLIVAGPGSWVDELVAVVGGDNVMAGAPTRYPKISTEEVLRAKPEIIIDLSYSARSSIKEWNELDVPGKRVVTVKDAFLLAPSPRIAPALAILANLIR